LLHSEISKSIPSQASSNAVAHSESTTVLSTPVSSATSVNPDSLASVVVSDIPEPPIIPVEELVAAAAQKLAAHGGEAPFSELGLGGWSPSGMVQQCLEIMHVSGGLPWWACILTGNSRIIYLFVFFIIIKNNVCIND